VRRQAINLNILATKLRENWRKKKQFFFCGWLFSKYHLPQRPWIFPKSVVAIPIWTHAILSAFSYGHFQKRNVFRKVLASLRTTNTSLSEKMFTISIPERMTEGEKSSLEPWNRRLSHWFSRGTKNTHMIGSFYFAWKLKICLALFSASATYYKYARTEKLFGVGNFAY